MKYELKQLLELFVRISEGTEPFAVDEKSTLELLQHHRKYLGRMKLSEYIGFYEVPLDSAIYKLKRESTVAEALETSIVYLENVCK